jgi:drug/metabolite transporter (DMT)-like permease
MMGIAAVIVIAQGMMLLLNQYFTVEDIMTGICACIIAGTFYVIFTMFVEQERRKDQSQGAQ